MKVFLIYVGDILHCPPALTTIRTLSELNKEVVVCTNEFDYRKTTDDIVSSSNIRIEFIGEKYNPHVGLVKKIAEMPTIKKRIWTIIDKEYQDGDLIWVIDGGNLKYLGSKLLKYKYILHLLELTEDLYYVESRHMLPISRQFAKSAKAVIECEYNRAHITKAWWELNKLPVVFPNKPYDNGMIKRRSNISTNEAINSLISNLRDKKIILYQGNISKERPLAPFLEAVEELGEPFVFVAMVNGDSPFPNYKGKQFYHIPFIAPPYHLEVTSNAYIGILSYTPIKNDYSILNTLYCAPNKSWEYAMFGVPVISNELPALRMQYLEYGNGISFGDFDKDSIINAIRKIDANYVKYSKAAEYFYNSVDTKDIISEVLSK